MVRTELDPIFLSIPVNDTLMPPEYRIKMKALVSIMIFPPQEAKK
jgi:hypothetical protein